jgi:putative phage-type endonuclease
MTADYDIEGVIQMIDLYLQDHFYIISNPDFEEILMADLKQLYGLEEEEEGQEEIKDVGDDCLVCDGPTKYSPLYDGLYYFYLYVMPRREFETTFTYSNQSIDEMTRKIQYIMGKPQPAQKTSEWYEYRRSVITASNLYKVFGSPSVKNELIYEKCKVHIAPTISEGDATSVSYVNTNSSLHWGNKYEPLSVIMYEHIYSTTICSLGCITHDTIPFIGASPDGMNANPLSPRYGRLVEIKNVKSREIDGTISEAYWIQMQIQMEVCDINECDFVETKFIEYDGYTDYMEDQCEVDMDDCDEYEYDYTKYTRKIIKGMMLYFHKPTEPPKYVYKPLSVLPGMDEEMWETKTTDEYVSNGYQWITNIYWKLVVFNCQLVMRNRYWFSKALPHVEDVWNTIVEERVSGFDHRKPKQSSRSKRMDQHLF